MVGFAGLALSSAMRFAALGEKAVRAATDTETLMVSVERVQAYSNLPTEAPSVIEDRRPDPQWPAKGVIIFSNVKLR